MTEPRHIAAAICRLAHPTLVRAWHYVMDWHALEQARCPADIRRHGLRVPAGSRLLEPTRPEQTEALALVDAWGGKSGVMIGQPGIGKSFAAVQWLLAYARRGKTIRWEQCSSWAVGDKSFDRERPRILAVQALVLDDIGAGNMSAWLLGELNAIVATRFDAGLRTLVSTNEAEYEVKQANGRREAAPLCSERITSRLRGHVRIVDGEPLRRADDGLTLNAWQRARLLLELVGVTDSAELQVWPGQRQPDRPLPSYDDVRFGGSLAVRLHAAELEAGPTLPERPDNADARAAIEVARSKAKREIVERVCSELELDPREVSRMAAKLERESTDHAAADALAEAARVMARSHEAAEPPPKPRPQPVTRAHLDAVDARRRELQALPLDRSPTLDRAALTRMGYAVTRTRLGEYRLMHHGRLIGDGPETEDACWRAIAKIHEAE